MVFSKANDDSPDTHKGVQLPKIATSSLPTASTDYEGFIAYDVTQSKLTFCTGSSWETVTSS